MRRHATHVVGGRRGRTVGGTHSRVVLAPSPGETDARVTNGVALHLVDGHLGRVAVDELHEAAALAGRDLDVGDLAEALEEGAELVLGDVAREAADEDGRVVGVRELVHGLHGVECGALVVVRGGAPHGGGVGMAGHRVHHGVGTARSTVAAILVRPVTG